MDIAPLGSDLVMAESRGTAARDQDPFSRYDGTSADPSIAAASEAARPHHTPFTFEPATIIQISPFFKLSGELKNNIYRFALVDPETIEVTSIGYSRNGGLLGSCKEIRTEALGIFYGENTFFYSAKRFDPRPIIRWKRTNPYKNTTGITECTISARRMGSEPSWCNLLLWIQFTHSHKTFKGGVFSPRQLQEKGKKDMKNYVLGGMFELARNLRGLPWTLVEETLENQRPALILLDERWANDE